jgi:hypothetical protein
MKNLILITILVISFADSAYSQISIDSSHFFLYKKDTAVWLEDKNILFLCRQNSVRELIASYKVSKKRLPFRIDSVQVVIQVTHQNEVKDKYVLHPNGDYMLDTISDNKPMVYKKYDQYVFYSRKYCSFINASPLGTDVFIFKKTRQTMFGKKNWYYVNGQGFSVLRHKNRLSYNGKGTPADLSNITLLDWNKVRAEYGNGIIKIHTYDPKTNKFEVETIKNEAKK